MTKKDFQIIDAELRFYAFSDPQDRINIIYEFARSLKSASEEFCDGCHTYLDNPLTTYGQEQLDEEN